MKTAVHHWIKSHWVTVLLIAILLLGGFLRLYRISEYMTFLGDEGRDMLVMKRMIIDHKFTLLGPTASVGGFFLGPIYYYFMLPFVFVWGLNPVGAAVMVALFGIATIYVVYRLGSDMFDRPVGFIAALLYSVSPLVIAYSRSSWNPNLVPFFSALVIYFLWSSVANKRPQRILWVGVALGVGLQLHYLFLFMFPVVAVWYLFYGRSRTWRAFYVLGVLGFLIGYGPFLLFELRHGFPNTIAIVNFLRAGEGTGFEMGRFMGTMTDVTHRLFGRLVFRLPPPEQWVSIAAWQQYAWMISIKFAVISSLGIIAAYILRFLPLPAAHIKQDAPSKRAALVLLLVWFVVPVLLFGLYKKGIYDYYFGIFFVLPFVLVALVLRAMQVSRIGTYISYLVLAFLVVLNWQGRPFVHLPNNQLLQAQTIAKAAFDIAEGKPFNFALITGGNSDHAYRFFFEVWGNAPITIENVEKDPERKTVTGQLIVICETEVCKPLGHPLWEIAGFGRAQIAGEWQVSFVKIMKLVPYEGEDAK